MPEAIWRCPACVGPGPAVCERVNTASRSNVCTGGRAAAAAPVETIAGTRATGERIRSNLRIIEYPHIEKT
jgi:hypothetical protein